MSNNSTLLFIAPSLTAFEEWLQYTVFYIGFGLVGAIGNVAIANGIVRSKDLRTRFFVVIFTLVSVRVALACQFIVMGVHRILKTLSIVSTDQKRIACYALHYVIDTFYTVELCLMLVLVIDRMLAIMTPIFYKNLSRRQAKIVCVGVVIGVGGVCKTVPTLIGWDFNEIISCTSSFSPFPDSIKRFLQSVDLPLIILLIFMYCLLWIVVKIRIRRLKMENRSDKETQLKKKAVLLPLLRNIIVAHATFTFTSRLLIAVIAYFPKESLRLTALSGNVNTMDLVVNVVALIMSNKQIRVATVPACCRRDRGNSSLPNAIIMVPANPVAVAPGPE